MTPVIIQIPGNPVPKSRPRFVNGHVHTDTKTRDEEERIKWVLKAAKVPLFTGPVKLEMHFHRQDMRRADIDNLQKLLLDACNGVCFKDDSQIVELHAVLERGHEEPGTWLKVSPL